MNKEMLASFLQRGPFSRDGDCVIATNTGPGYGDIVMRCCNGRCPDDTVVSATELAAHIAEVLNGMSQQNAPPNAE